MKDEGSLGGGRRGLPNAVSIGNNDVAIMSFCVQRGEGVKKAEKNAIILKVCLNEPVLLRYYSKQTCWNKH